MSYFSIPIFFVLFRESTEASIIISILLAAVSKQDDNVSMKRQIWFGGFFGLLLSLLIGGIFVAIAIFLKNDLWPNVELIWEGIFSLLASILIAFMGVSMLKTHSLVGKWSKSLFAALPTSTTDTISLEKTSFIKRIYLRLFNCNSLFWLPFITLLREGIEGVVFIFGLSLQESPTSIPIAAVTGLICGAFIGILVYKLGDKIKKLSIFFAIATIILYFIAAGLFSTAIFKFESQVWNSQIQGILGGDDVAVPTFDLRYNVFVLDFGSPNVPDSGWQILKVFVGWNNIGSVFTLSGYCLFWMVLSISLILVKLKGRRSTV